MVAQLGADRSAAGVGIDQKLSVGPIHALGVQHAGSVDRGHGRPAVAFELGQSDAGQIGPPVR